MKKSITMLFLMLLLPVATEAQTSPTLRQQMEQLHQQRDINFVYDASLNVSQSYKGPVLKDLPLTKALAELFNGTDIDYQVNGKYVMLFKARERKQAQRTHTLSGHVRDSIGETLINATIYDQTTRQGTMSNEFGFFSLTLPEGEHQLRVSYIGHTEQNFKIQLSRNQDIEVRLNSNTKLGEVIVSGDLNSPISGTQMGKRSLSQSDIKTEFALFSSPDVVKTLQRISGVQEGIELSSGLYVHGGNNDENLFLIDGTPLYSVNHSLGLFSSFNADVVKNVEFYKSGFPARYGGRLSSVVDVRTNDGNMQEWHGSYRIGLLDGSFQIDGPLRKNRTSLNLGLRRSWLDLLTTPAFFIANKLNSEENLRLSYHFHDLNLKLTHLLNNRQRLSLTVYSGGDGFTARDDWNNDKDGHTDTDKMENCMSWGNLNAAIDWNVQISPQLMGNFTTVYTHNRSKVSTWGEWRHGDEHIYVEHNEHSTTSTIDDIGYRTLFDYRPLPRHHIRFGHDYTLHLFRPQTKSQLVFAYTDSRNDTLKANSHNHHTGHELNLYLEDQVTLSGHWSVNAGVNLSLFRVSGKSFTSADPRLAVKCQPLPNLSVKASYTVMSQYVHKICNSFLDLPSDYWVPTTRRTRPMRSCQWALGAYSQWGKYWTLSIEGYYKRTYHLLQYSNWNGLEPPAESWDEEVIDGRGLFYGIETDVSYHRERLTVEAAYTLSWNKRKFDDFYEHWYYDKFDHRHKLNIQLRLHLSAKSEMYAAWNFHSGNRMTLPTQYTLFPTMPGFENPRDSRYFSKGSFFWQNRRDLIYERPNNISLPAYHRLDVGFNLHHRTKHGHERIWNWSIYNAYCHLNTMWTNVKEDTDGNLYVKCRAYIPIIPSFSYTIKF